MLIKTNQSESNTYEYLILVQKWFNGGSIVISSDIPHPKSSFLDQNVKKKMKINIFNGNHINFTEK